MTLRHFLALLILGWAASADARDAPWVIAVPALTDAATAIAGPGARVETSSDEEDAVTTYCKGLGAQTADALVLTRRLLDRERASCAAEAIAVEPERVLGTIGLAVDGAPPGLARRHIWRAIAAEVSDDGKLAENRIRTWREVSPELPDRPIALRVETPVPTIEALILAPGCMGATGYAKLDRKRLCQGLRRDLPAGPDPLVIRPLGTGGDPIEGFLPSEGDVTAGRYPLSRRVYLYLKRPHLLGIAGLSALQSASPGPSLARP